MSARRSCACFASALLALGVLAAEADDIRELKLKDWKPRSMLVTKVSRVDKPTAPVVDAHNHLGDAKDVAKIVKAMDAAGVRTVINLDGGSGDELRVELKRFDQAYPGRFLTYALVDFRGVDAADWGPRRARQLERDFRAGAKGLKIHKSLGLGVRYKSTGKLMRVDDPKIDPIWAMCARHKRPVMIHVADPVAFFTPLDRTNERWHELNEHPGWLFHGKDYPSYTTLIAQLKTVIKRHPKTTFVGAHVASQSEDLRTVGQWLDELPNFYVDINARINELGRQPYTARRFLIKYQDRILFGTDTLPSPEMYRLYYRFLETDDEHWDTALSHHRQGFWMVYSVFLPKEVLQKLYHRNAERVLGVPK
jgi:predicted TIM-barrel fold metal-dependent hydrolase